MKNSFQITKKGLEELKVKLNELKEVKRPQLVERLAGAREGGDLRENSDYMNAKEELEMLDQQIAEIEEILKNAKIVDGENLDNKSVSVGNRVTLKSGENLFNFWIVSEWEADPQQQKISVNSPLGRALMGKTKGEIVEVNAPAGKTNFEIVSID